MNGVISTVQSVVHGQLNSNPTADVIELEYVHVERLVEVNDSFDGAESGGIFRTCYDEVSGVYHCLLKHMDNTATFSLLRHSVKKVADSMTKLFAEKLTPFIEVPSLLHVDALSKIAEVCCNNPYWSSAHMALEAGMTMALKSELIQKEINSTSCEQRQTPLHLAMAKNDTNLIEILIEAGASPDISDEKGNTPLHYATDPSYDHFIPMLMDASEVKNPQNLNLETPINVASRKGNAEATAKFFEHGGDFSIPDRFTYPIIHAFEDENYEMAKLILKLDPTEGRRQSPTGQTPLHLVISEDQVDMVCQGSHSLNAQDNNGDTAVHVMVKAEELDITINLLGKSANPEIPDNEGNTPLHTAAKLNNLSLVQAMIVFGVNINHKNKKNETARHIAANNKEAASAVLQALHMVGAERCDANMSGCQPGCKFDGTDDGEVPVKIFDTTPEINKAYNEIFENLSTILSQPWSDKDYEENQTRRRKDAMLTLDGGGMRGIITCQILRAIQRAADRKIVDCFDWVAGTSTGALTAAMLCTGYSVDDCLRQFFYMKDKVFAGPRPYDNENFEKLTRESFPEHIKMSDVQGPKLIITTTLSNRIPAALHCFRNYHPPMTSSSNIEACTGIFENPPDDYDKCKLWEAVRSSVAAPSYFFPYKSYLDGGLICNNPTVDALTEATEYYAEKKQHNMPYREIGMVVSVGTGSSPVAKVDNITMYVPSGLSGIYQALKNAKGSANVGNLIMAQVTESTFRPVDRSRAWCLAINAAFYRFSPSLSSDIDLAETDNVMIMQMMWEGHAYLYKCKDQINKLGELLNLL